MGLQLLTHTACQSVPLVGGSWPKSTGCLGILFPPLGTAWLAMQGQEMAQEASGGLGSLPMVGSQDQEPEGSRFLRRKVHFQLPHTTIPLPSARQEEQLFYQRLEHLLAAAAAKANGSFEELFAADGWEDLLEDRSLRKRLVSGGRGESSRPRPGQEVTVKLLGVLEDQSLVEKDPHLCFILGQGGAIQALERGVLSMQLGEVAFLLARPTCAYGCLGREPDIPQEAALLYEVTLLQVRDSPDPARLPASQRLSLAIQQREWGNFHFERAEYQQALGSYQLALQVTAQLGTDPLGPEEAEALQEHRVKCLNNCAATQLKLQQPEEALVACNEVLRLDPENVKALHRKGRLLSEQGEDQAAMDALKRALQLEPATKAIHVELSKLARRQRGQLDQPSSEESLREDFPVTTAASSSQVALHRCSQAEWLLFRNWLQQASGQLFSFANKLWTTQGARPRPRTCKTCQVFTHLQHIHELEELGLPGAPPGVKRTARPRKKCSHRV